MGCLAWMGMGHLGYKECHDIGMHGMCIEDGGVS